jgi:hypothetical protein
VTRTLLHSFDPPGASPVAGPTVDLEVSEIEDASALENRIDLPRPEFLGLLIEAFLVRIDMAVHERFEAALERLYPV